ncbi:MAG TPA: SMP-30/gluconolactonase/LRE family protein [Caulobacteraceae bacterium]|jgi:hypothetical protein
MKRRVLALCCAFAAAVAAGSHSAKAADGKACGEDGPLHYVCGANNVEDMIQVPGTRWLIGSNMYVGRTPKTGTDGLYLIDSDAKTVQRATIALGPEPKRGPFAGCAPPDLSKLASHGLELRPGKGGQHTLYAVNHGGRETIEVFRVDANKATPAITWTGCLKSPPNAWLNSIAALPDGGLAFSRFGDIDHLDMVPVFKGEDTGFVYIWEPSTGFKELPNSKMSGTNGMLVSADGRWLYVNDQGRWRIARLDLRGSQPPAYVKLDFHPDNLRWAPDGAILAAGQIIQVGGSLGAANGWGVARVDPKTMTAKPLMNEPGRPGFSNGTVALEVGKTLWLGTFRGDRIAYVTLK